MVLIHAKVLDPTHLELARPLSASCVGNVVVVLTESTDADTERKQWIDGSSPALRRAYGDAEPEYTPSMVREANPRKI
jgi:hypothetical protein